jgi:hypothetical protein
MSKARKASSAGTGMKSQQKRKKQRGLDAAAETPSLVSGRLGAAEAPPPPPVQRVQPSASAELAMGVTKTATLSDKFSAVGGESPSRACSDFLTLAPPRPLKNEEGMPEEGALALTIPSQGNPSAKPVPSSSPSRSPTRPNVHVRFLPARDATASSTSKVFEPIEPEAAVPAAQREQKLNKPVDNITSEDDGRVTMVTPDPSDETQVSSPSLPPLVSSPESKQKTPLCRLDGVRGKNYNNGTPQTPSLRSIVPFRDATDEEMNQFVGDLLTSADTPQVTHKLPPLFGLPSLDSGNESLLGAVTEDDDDIDAAAVLTEVWFGDEQHMDLSSSE